MIHKYWNMIVGSDVYPHEIVNVISDKTLEVRRMDSEELSAAYEENQKWKSNRRMLNDVERSKKWNQSMAAAANSLL